MCICRIVNDAYVVETGSTGISFKKGPRFESPTEGKLYQGYVEGRILKVTEKETGRIVGMVYWELSDANTICFGPFAVSPEDQGKGVGSLLLAEVERIARERNLIGMDIQVINLRTELIAWYTARGYEYTGTSPYPSEHVHRLTQPVHFYEMRRPLKYDVLH